MAMTRSVPRVDLAPGLSISRLVTGLWQLADMARDGRSFDQGAAVDAERDSRERLLDAPPDAFKGVVCSRCEDSGWVFVAERTDPSWILIMPAAAGLLIARGSLLSHTAIVARELGIPAIVGLAGVTQWLHEGDEVEFDGGSGVVRKLAG